MPSFANNNENLPIRPLNPSAIHPHTNGDHRFDLLNGSDMILRKRLPSTVNHHSDSLGHSSPSPSASFQDLGLRVNGEGADSLSMPPLTNGAPKGLRGPNSADNAAQKGQNGTAAVPEKISAKTSLEEPVENGLSPVSLPLSQLQSYETAPSQNSVDLPSPTRTPAHPISLDLPPKPLQNGDILPLAESARPPALAALPSDEALTDFPKPSPPSTPMIPDSHSSQPSSPHRLSSPPAFHSTGQTPSSSSPALYPPHPGNTLKHRHTLEVPKLQPSRSSRDGSDTAYASGRFSPTTGPGQGVRRASLTLGRRNTRSMHSDPPRDEVIPDDDALRWAEAYRQKRARKKRREEEDDDDRVLVGIKVDESHANWATAYNMLTGIRVSVSRTNAKLDRPLTDADFFAKQKSTFDIAGNELVPSAKYDFKFKDYAPWVFRHLRALFRLDPADYLMSLTGKYILSELGSPGKSGSFFYFSRDYKYIIKTIHHAEHKFLRKILKDYYEHVSQNPNTLISQFYGLHRVKMPYGRKIHFVIMNNLFPQHRDIHQTFDLKGSTVGRDYREEDLEKNPRATLKDLNWLRRRRHLELGIHKKHLFLQQLERDVRLLQKLKIMDYSLLIGIHDLRKGNEENLRDKTLQLFNPTGDGPSDELDRHSVLMRTPSKLESARKTRELRQMLKSERPVPLGQTPDRMPDELAAGHCRGGIFYADDGGLRATHENNSPGDEVYYLGVIDCLTHYGAIKKIEHFWKGLSHESSQISALPPEEYGDRFIQFMSGITISAEEAQRDEEERQAAAARMAAAETEEPGRSSPEKTSHAGWPPAPSYLPPAPPPMRSTKSTEPNSIIEKAKQKAFKTELKGASEEDVPERIISTTAATSGSMATKSSGHAVLPIVEEAGEAGSVGSPNLGEKEAPRPYAVRPMGDQGTPNRTGFTNLGPNGIGGKGPPTPPKTSYLDPEELVGGRKRSGSGSGTSIRSQGMGKRISRESLDKALPRLPDS